MIIAYNICKWGIHANFNVYPLWLCDFHCNYQFNIFSIFCLWKTHAFPLRGLSEHATHFRANMRKPWISCVVIKLRMWAGFLQAIKECSIPPRKIGQQITYYVGSLIINSLVRISFLHNISFPFALFSSQNWSANLLLCKFPDDKYSGENILSSWHIVFLRPLYFLVRYDELEVRSFKF